METLWACFSDLEALWACLSDHDNQQTLKLLGGGLVAVTGAGWAVFAFFFGPDHR